MLKHIPIEMFQDLVGISERRYRQTVESISDRLLGLGGAGLGMLGTLWSLEEVRTLLMTAVANPPADWAEFAIDSRCLAFSLLAGIAIGLLSGLPGSAHGGRQKKLSTGIARIIRSASAGPKPSAQRTNPAMV